ncbi:MAG TPA: hypothetical protein VMM93_12500 [Vicinamibacterales bacterium]|nr:hypothetical protein [Vicinamibacterales bacterium]
MATGTYNTQLWPAALLLWLATAVVAWRWLTGGRPSERLVLAPRT